MRSVWSTSASTSDATVDNPPPGTGAEVGAGDGDRTRDIKLGKPDQTPEEAKNGPKNIRCEHVRPWTR